MLWIILGVLWLMGAITVVLCDAYFGCKWADEPSIIPLAVFWFITMPFMILGILYIRVEALGKRHRQQKQQAQKIRIAQEQEVEKIMMDLEQEEKLTDNIYQKSV